MKKILILFIFILPINILGQNSQSSFDIKQKNRIDSLFISNEALAVKNFELIKKIELLEKEIARLTESTKISLDKITINIDSLIYNHDEITQDLKQRISVKASSQEVYDLIDKESSKLLAKIISQGQTISENSEAFNSEVKSIEEKVEIQKDNINTNTSYLDKNSQYISISLVLGLILLILSLVIYFISSKNKVSISAAQDDIKQILDLDSGIKSLIEKQTEILAGSSSGQSNDKSIEQVKMVADEIITMENNIYHMDPDTRGLSKIVRAIKSLRNNFHVMGYQIPMLLDTEYKEGDVVEITNEKFDETVEQGKKIICRVSKPRIDFEGKMIQRPKVEIKYNT
tara:strand:+ start:1095 stop:2123 length:1029 start_codon:yes stop_codon:yes gene_type:complete